MKPFFSFFLLIFALAMTNTGCTNQGEESPATEEDATAGNVYGVTEEGDTVRQFTLTNENGVEVDIITYGGIITSLRTPDKEGNIEDIVLGFDSLEPYTGDHPFFGAIIGRYGNRIKEGKFTLDSVEYQLPTNNAPNHLHGGPEGFHTKVWQGESFETDRGQGVRLTYTSEDGEMGYPGTLDVTVSFLLTADNELEMDYNAKTDKKTIVNLTNHSYFNLSGNLDTKILDHVLMINADSIVPVDSTLIPTGELMAVEGTPLDFTEPTEIGDSIAVENEQISLGGGYDHCWALNGEAGQMKLAATVHHPESGRYMEVRTTEPGIQFYSGNFLDGSLTGKDGIAYQHRSGLCLETQHYPDSPNQSGFPSVVLKPGQTYSTKTIYKFSTK